MRLEFLPPATSELLAAAEHYEAQQPGLGWRFRCEIRQLCQAIVQQPRLWQERPGGYRRVNCPLFPYYIAYFIRGEVIVIAAVAHGHRHPDYWKHRLNS